MCKLFCSMPRCSCVIELHANREMLIMIDNYQIIGDIVIVSECLSVCISIHLSANLNLAYDVSPIQGTLFTLLYIIFGPKTFRWCWQ